MSDRDHEELFLTRLRLILAAGHTAAYDLRADISELLNERRAVLAAAPVEPPVLSREFLDSLIEALPLPYRTDPPTAKWAKEGAKLLATAILESLSQEAV